MGEYLKGKAAVVTGAGRGIGREVACWLAKEGASVVVNDLGGAVDGSGASSAPADEVVTEIRAAGGTAVPNYDSVATFAGAGRIIQAAIDSFGKIDILCHVAGILRDRMVFNMAEEEWDAVLSVHLGGAFNTVRHAVPHMIRQRSGRILIFSSGSGLGNSGQANYSAAKEGQVGFARALARELAPYNIAVNAIYPGGNTRMTQSVPDTARQIRAQRGIAGGGAMAGRPPGDTIGQTEARDPILNAPKAAYLCTEQAAGITGQVIGTSSWPMTLYSPRHLSRVISKNGRWTLDELDVYMKEALVAGLVNPAPPAEPRPAGST